ncbi:hypothetical protein D915_009679 [Fasciola hepatica]|uniref:Uncharacterized protein n=1 Tax=Fasciola hepatica TaxID=6192 RepID=A0A4E0RS74_FASHE|nr:hypothetical protein D915_009679 [Fasciola hepatica]
MESITSSIQSSNDELPGLPKHYWEAQSADRREAHSVKRLEAHSANRLEAQLASNQHLSEMESITSSMQSSNDELPGLPKHYREAQSANRREAHPANRIEAYSVNRMEAHSVNRMEAHSVNRMEAHSANRKEAHPANRKEAHPANRMEAHSVNRMEAYSVNRMEAHSAYRREAQSANRRVAQSANGSTSSAKLQRELRLAGLKLKQLELEAEAAKRIGEIKDEIVKELSDYNCCFGSEPLLPPTPPPGGRLKIVHDYVMSLPGSKTRQEDQITLNGPGLRVLPAESRKFDRVSETAGLLQACMSLPARQSVKFDGNPVDFISFMRNFQFTVARFNNDPAYLLDYLISACEGEPAGAIRWCMVLKPQEGYDKAIRILERRYRPCCNIRLAKRKQANLTRWEAHGTQT